MSKIKVITEKNWISDEYSSVVVNMAISQRSGQGFVSQLKLRRMSSLF